MSVDRITSLVHGTTQVGTFIFNAAGARERVDKIMTPVPDVCEIEFGQGSKFKVTKVSCRTLGLVFASLASIL